jgi:hypothetical protein
VPMQQDEQNANPFLQNLFLISIMNNGNVMNKCSNARNPVIAQKAICQAHSE